MKNPFLHISIFYLIIVCGCKLQKNENQKSKLLSKYDFTMIALENYPEKINIDEIVIWDSILVQFQDSSLLNIENVYREYLKTPDSLYSIFKTYSTNSFNSRNTDVEEIFDINLVVPLIKTNEYVRTIFLPVETNAIEILREKVVQDFNEINHPLSTGLYKWDGQKFDLF